MNARKFKSTDIILTPVPSSPANNLVMEMVKAAEQEIEQDLGRKRDRLKLQFDDEIYKYYREIKEKQAMLCDEEFNVQRMNLDRLKIDRETERQKYVELKRLQQHMQNCDEIRSEASKRLRENCEKTLKEQIQEKQNREAMIRAADQMYRDEIEQKSQQEDWEKQQEAERIRQQRKLEIKQELEKRINKSKSSDKRNEHELERKLQEQQNEVMKSLMAETKKEKQREIQCHTEFLQRQIEQRKRVESLHQQRDIEYGKAMAELAKQELQHETAEIEHAKKLRHVENIQFLEYLNRMRADKRETEAVEFDPKQISLITEEFDDDARRWEEKRLLKEEKRSQYFRELKERHEEKLRQKEQEFGTFSEQQRQNAEYEQMMAEKKAQNRAQIQQDLDYQIQQQNTEMARKREDELRCNQQLEEIQRVSNNLTRKLLTDDVKNVKGLFKEHPFYHCLQSNCSKEKF